MNLATLPNTIGGMRSQLVKTKDALARTKTKALSIIEESKSKIDGTMRVVKVGASCGGASYLVNRFGKGTTPAQLFGIDADMLGGGAVFTAALLGWAGEYEEHAFDIAAGLACSYLGREGAQLGMKAQVPAGAAGGVRDPSAWVPRR